VHLEMDLDKLDKFVQKAKKKREYFRKWEKKRKEQGKPTCGRIFFKHLNPELTFMFRY